MAEAGAARLVLVRAPAGFGKTTAMVQVRDQLEEKGVATAWLTLDRADNDVPRSLDEKRILWAAGDIVETRPPLSRNEEERRKAAASQEEGDDF